MAQSRLEVMTKWVRHRVECGFYRLLMALIPLLPHRLLLVIARVAAWVGPVLVFWEANKARVNLEIAFGDSLLKKEKNRILRESFENLILTALYFFWSPNINADNVQDFIELPPSSVENIRKIKKLGKGAIGILGHYGNWELMGLGGGFYEFPRLNVIVRALKNPLLDDLVNDFRCRSGNRVIERERSMIKAMRVLKRGEIVVLVFDQSFDPSLGGIFVPFFGLPAATTRAAAVLSLKTGAPIVPTVCEPIPGGRYRIRFEEPVKFEPTGNDEEDIYQLTAQCTKYLEDIIRQRPGPWVWMYKRWRVRPTVEKGDYPDYSKPAKHLRKQKKEEGE